MILRSARPHDATSPCDQSQGPVASCELLQNLVAETKTATSPTNSNWFEFVGLDSATRF